MIFSKSKEVLFVELYSHRKEPNACKDLRSPYQQLIKGVFGDTLLLYFFKKGLCGQEKDFGHKVHKMSSDILTDILLALNVDVKFVESVGVVGDLVVVDNSADDF